MSHYAVMLKFKMDESESLGGVEEAIKDMLEPFSEELQVEKYPTEDRTPETIMEDLNGVIQRITGSEVCPDYLEHYKNDETIKLFRDVAFTYKFDGWVGVVAKYRKELNESFMESWCGHEIAEDGIVYTQYNPASKWDWYVIGGHWEKELIEKDGIAVDVAWAKDLDFGKLGTDIETAETQWNDAEGKSDTTREWQHGIKIGETKEQFIKRRTTFYTFAVLDYDGWHSRAEMGWFGFSHDETESLEDWATNFKKRFFSNLEEDDVIAIVDCHI